ncbi:hypothetical protein CANINC_001372 [Pichia inconspicua]|uniref:Histone-lysine N-methyltransferase, H3 lysine-36 specific n=1 Tax=Pichia inconspicua TaxID=52247 RepID=A0A4T0X442_9ASCO|nr:hypothetical protein CANINC_001372 [[Candida] inconspicua]
MVEFTSITAKYPKSETPVLNHPLFLEYEDKTEEVRKQFVELKENQYIGRLKHVYSASNEFMTCDCTEEIEDGINVACGPESDCINRLTNIECVDGQCGCGDDCLNQRFQRREYADVSIFLTENKGYGMRANSSIIEGSLIIEYMGDIVDAEEYKLRKQKYDAEGLKHFYFMMIQDNEIIDATKRASLGRYCNHSCDPNAYVDKWVVNKRYRMGIFAKRNITAGEEICFDYNVDRYGAEPQKCYCGSENCLGVMGGKTQSETVRLLPHTITEALGVRASDEKKWLKEQKKSGVKVTKDNLSSNVNVEFVKSLTLEPLEISDVAKISSCLMQPDLDAVVIRRIIERFLLSSNNELCELLIRFNRLHGIQALGHALKTIISSSVNSHLTEEQKQAIADIIVLLENWPQLKSKNSIQDIQLEESLKLIQSMNIDDDYKPRIETLLENWRTLDVIYRIPKKVDQTIKTILDDRRSRSSDETSMPSSLSKIPKGPANSKPWGDIDISNIPKNQQYEGVPLPPGWEWAYDAERKSDYFFNRSTNTTQWDKPEWPRIISDEETTRKRKEREKELERIRKREIRELKVLERQRELLRQQSLKQHEETESILSSIIQDATKSNNISNDSNSRKRVKIGTFKTMGSLKKKKSEDVVEKQWHSHFASYVPNAIKKYEATIGRDNLKSCARDIVHLLTEKEMKRHAGENVPASLSEERKLKIKSFCKAYMVKFMQKYEEKAKKKRQDKDLKKSISFVNSDSVPLD